MVTQPADGSGQVPPERSTGPVIQNFGGVYPVPNPDFETDTDATYRVAFEVAQPAESPDEVNAQINTLARFLNMHAQAGVDPADMHLALVVHGPAGKDMLDNATYRQRYGVDNPNLPLLEELDAAGVQVILCGQTAMSRNLPRDRLAPQVRVALSAMTALWTLQARGYHLNAF
jgi:intracellular sulfur oxidation DsrE/DsrF family protein